MATLTTGTMECDIPSPGHDVAVRTVKFSLDRNVHEIDLCETHEAWILSNLGPFLAHARVAKSASAVPRKRTVLSRKRSADIRKWAREHGHDNVSDLGRIPASIVAEYEYAEANG